MASKATVPASSEVARSTRLLLAVLAWTGLALQLFVSVHRAMGNGRGLPWGLIAYFGYFTVLTNLMVALVCSVPRLYRSSLLGCATTSIIVVGIGFHILLSGIWAPQGLGWLANALQHYGVPIVAALHWLAYRGPRLDWTAPLRWCAWPIVYFGYAMLRGQVIGRYPYPFIDVIRIGYSQTLINAAGLLVAFIATGYVVVATHRALAA